MKKLSGRLLIVLLVLAAFGVRAHAAGTTSGTTITNFATMTASNVLSATQSNTINTIVTSVYGMATDTLSDPADNTVTAGSFADYVVGVENTGNISDNIAVNVGAFAFGAGSGTPASWSVAADDNSTFVTGLTWKASGAASAASTGDWATAAAPISPGGRATFTVRVESAADAADASTMAFVLSYQTANSPAGAYTGFNGTNYGGNAVVYRAAGAGGGPTYLTTTVSGAVLTLAKAASVQAPGSYGGGSTDPVPGAKITYTLTYGNSGAADAQSVVLVDYIPTNTTYKPGTINTSAFGAMTDVVDVDECDYDVTNTSAVTCNIGTVLSAGSGTVSYIVTID